MPAVTTIDLVYFNAGGGHRSAALALEAVIRDQARPWQIRLVNLLEVLDPHQVFRKTTGMNPEDLYNKRLAQGWTAGLAQELKLLQALIRLGHRSLTARLRRHWRKTRPDLVVSLVPNFNRAMYQALAVARPAAPYVTILTDFADYPPHFWMEPDQAQHLVCGTSRAVAQARALGYGEERIHATSGMILRPDFYRAMPFDRSAERIRRRLDPQRPTGLVLFGGHGSRQMRSIAARLDDMQLILLCGHNAALAARLRAMPARAPRLVVGFTAEIRYYMQLADFFIGKPGPGSISEAVRLALPVIVVRNAWTMPQERYNTDWVSENGAGLVLESFRSIRDGVALVVARLDEFRAGVARIDNRAVFEIPDLLERILRSGTRPQPAAASRRAMQPQSAARPLH
jgi:UDP-N-acetylglucosamine:LPS N-acetylglucosamine transferase